MSDKQAVIARTLFATSHGFLTDYTTVGGWVGLSGRGAGIGAGRIMKRIERNFPGVPWHRVVGKNGEINGPDAAEQRRLLESEGVKFTADGRVIFP